MLPLIVATALAQSSPAPAESQGYAAQQARPDVPPDKPLKVLVLSQMRGVATNIVSSNPFLDGQVLGVLGGTNGLLVEPGTRSAFTEQRAGAFFTWKPDVFGGKLGFNGAVEIDMAWGDRAYGVGANVGGGFGGDVVNIQTRRLTVDLWERLGKRGRHKVHVVAGLQFLADSVNDPGETTPDGLFRSGGRMMFFGSEASGLAAFGAYRTPWGERLRYRLGSYTLWEGGLGRPDDVWLNMIDVAYKPAYALEIGAHLWWMQDGSGGQGGLLGVGPSSGLAEMQVGNRLNPYGDTPRPSEGAGVDAQLFWTMLDIGYNADLTRGPLGFHGLVLLNNGRLVAREVNTVAVRGQLVDAEVRYRYAPGKGSIVRLEGMYSTPDDGDATNAFTGVITGQAYGFAGAVHNTHGTRLLFTDPQSINRMAAVVYDVSGADRGVMAVTSSVAYDVIPNRLNARVGFGTALAPQRGTHGTEVNAQLTFEPHPFFTPYVAAHYLMPGDQALIDDPAWMGVLGMEWVAF